VELSGSENSLKAEVADLRAAAVKLGALNEALALDKVELNQQLLQVSEGVVPRTGLAYLKISLNRTESSVD
jgi:hypothetical protein